MEKKVLCGSSAYEKKFYINEEFASLPMEVKQELQIMCVLFTEEIGGILLLEFDETGELNFITQAKENDYMYDEIGSALLVKKIRATKRELLDALSAYFRITFLHEDPSAVLAEEDDESAKE